MKPLDSVSPPPANCPIKQVVTEASEIKRSESHAPRSVQPITMFETHQESPVELYMSTNPKPGPSVSKSEPYLVERIGDDNIVADRLHVEGHVGFRQLLIHERIFRGVAVIGRILVDLSLGSVYRLKCIVINIHAALGEVGCIEVALAINESAGQARVAGSVGGSGHWSRHAWKAVLLLDL